MKQFAPATLKNRQPILEVLNTVIPPSGNILEIASGTGEHSIYFAPDFAPCQWQPSDTNESALQSISAWIREFPHANLLPPLRVDVMTSQWYQPFRQSNFHAIVCINMIHIAPWEATLGLLEGAGALLPTDGVLYLYGAYRRQGRHTAPSNESFDLSLQSRNPTWGVRNLETVAEVASSHGLKLEQVLAMPSNNLSVIFRKSKPDKYANGD